MLELFVEDENGFPKINVALKTIICFKKLIERDKGSEGDHDGRKKRLSTLEAAFIYWEGKYGSSFVQEYPDKTIRTKHIKKEVGLPDEWLPDALIDECIEWFRNSQRTKSMRLVENIEKVIDSMTDYFDTLDLTETVKEGKSKGELKHNIKDVQTAIEKMPSTISAVKEMKDTVREEIQQKVTGKGGRETHMFEQKKTKR